MAFNVTNVAGVNGLVIESGPRLASGFSEVRETSMRRDFAPMGLLLHCVL